MKARPDVDLPATWALELVEMLSLSTPAAPERAAVLAVPKPARLVLAAAPSRLELALVKAALEGAFEAPNFPPAASSAAAAGAGSVSFE